MGNTMRSVVFVFALSGATAWQAATLPVRSDLVGSKSSRSRNADMTMGRRRVVGGLAGALVGGLQQASAATESCDLWGLPCTGTGSIDWSKYGLDAKSLGLPTPPAPPPPPPPSPPSPPVEPVKQVKPVEPVEPVEQAASSPAGQGGPAAKPAAKEKAPPRPKPGESDRTRKLEEELAVAKAEDKAQAAAERLAQREQATQVAAEKKFEANKARAAQRAEAEAEAAQKKEEAAKKRAEGGKAGRGDEKPVAKAATGEGRAPGGSSADTRKQKAGEEEAAKKVAEEAAAKKEKVEQCKKNLWGLPCTEDGEVDRTVFGI